MIAKNIFIGLNAGRDFIDGEYCIFLGDGAGEGITSERQLFILKANVGEIRTRITKKQWQSFNDIIQGAICKEKW